MASILLWVVLMIFVKGVWRYSVLLAVLGACGDKAATPPGPDAGKACAASGASCAQSQCCVDPSESCTPQASGDSVCAHADPPPTTGPACNGVASSTLDGVSIVFPDDRCAYTTAELAAGIQIKYTLVIDHDLTGVVPAGGDAGQCARPDPTHGLILSGTVGGNGQSYCVCDVGRCAPPPASLTAPRAGRYDQTFAWTGHNWSGPSDTNNPLGAPFPAGTYTFTVTAVGKTGAGGGGGGPGNDFTVSASRFITVQP